MYIQLTCSAACKQLDQEALVVAAAQELLCAFIRGKVDGGVWDIHHKLHRHTAFSTILIQARGIGISLATAYRGPEGLEEGAGALLPQYPGGAIKNTSIRASGYL